ncbi:MAG TPA: fluoride efflux transporter CrcB [Acidimicrobiales bacterium]|nr:fluoride efflux transporter CrcB [Acidimicrobiales bacterium]
MKVALIAVAGALGALARFGIGSAAGTTSFPWPTLGINVVGSFLLGVVLRAGGDHGWSDTAVTALGTGFLGAFTTFSTFSVEARSLLDDGRAGAALAYVLLSVVLGIAAAALGYAAARAWA